MKKKQYFLMAAGLFLGSFGQMQAQDLEAGKTMFVEKCAACHSTSAQALTGPGLQGINDKRSKEWLHRWIKDSKGMIASGDSQAVALFAEYKQVEMQQFLELTDEQIDNILHYIKEGKGAVAIESDEELFDEAGRKISRADAQVKIWAKQSEGASAEVVVPMIVLAVFLVVMYFASVKVPGYPED
jgi:cytochrome c2